MAHTMKEALTSDEDKKLEYVNTQITEMNAIIRRNEVDIYINEDIEWSEAEQDAVDQQVKNLMKENAKLAKAIASLTKLKAELEA